MNPTNQDFWNSLIENSSSNLLTAAIDGHLSGKEIGKSFESVRSLVGCGCEDEGQEVTLPVEVGTPVMFQGDLDSMLSYENPPQVGEIGEVVVVKSASGKITSHEGKVFVSWASGRLLPVHVEHLRKVKSVSTGKTANRIKVSGLGDLTSFLKRADGKLIHKSTKDLWSMSKDADGSLVVERLFDDNGEPLKA